MTVWYTPIKCRMYDDDTIHNALGRNAMGWYLGNGGGRSAYGLSSLLFLVEDADPLAAVAAAAADAEEDSTSRTTPAIVVISIVVSIRFAFCLYGV